MILLDTNLLGRMTDSRASPSPSWIPTPCEQASIGRRTRNTLVAILCYQFNRAFEQSLRRRQGTGRRDDPFFDRGELPPLTELPGRLD